MPFSPGQAESRPYVPACPQARKSHRRACAPFGSAHVHPAHRVAPARDQPSLLTPLESGGPLFLHRLDVLAFFTVENVNVRQSVQVNTAKVASQPCNADIAPRSNDFAFRQISFAT